jgi:hypothetical protein
MGYPLVMPFRQTDLHDLDVAREVRVETHASTGDVHSTIVWVVVDQNEVFLRSVRGERGRWYREALATQQVTLDDEGRRLEAVVIPVDDAESIRRVDEALARKYANDEGYDTMFTPEAKEATVRLEPRTPNEIPLEAPAFLGADEPSHLHGVSIHPGPLEAGAPIDADVLLQPQKPA